MSPFQLKDYDTRARFMKSLGTAYTWVDFQKDIQRLAQDGEGWQRAWWREQVNRSFGEQATTLMACLPDWYYGGAIKAADTPKSYPMGLYNPPPIYGQSVPDVAPERVHASVNVLAVDGLNMEADTLDDIERIGVERGYTVGAVNRFKIAYWQVRGEDAWFDALGMSLQQYGIDLASLIRAPDLCQFGQQLPEDVAYRTALNMGRLASSRTHGQENQWVSMDSVSAMDWTPRRAPRSSTAWYPYSVPETPFPSLAPKGTDEPT